MDVCEFRDRIYGKYKTQLFVLEPAWDSLRPISFVGWNGRELEIVDKEYKSDLLSRTYGYGSSEMKQVCKQLLETTELGGRKVFADPGSFWKWCGHTSATWWRDRPCVFTSECVSRDIQSWKRYVRHLQSRPKTLRNKVVRRATKRLLVKERSNIK